LIRQGLTSLSNGILNNLIRPFGDPAIAAMAVVNRVSSFVMCVGLGIGQGFQPVASFNYQAKQNSRVKRGLVFTICLGFLLIGLLSLGSALFATPIVRLLQKEQAVIDIAVPALRYACVGLLFLPLSIPVNMLYQSIRRAGVSSFLSMLRSGLILVPALFIGAHFFGLKGIQWSAPIADIAVGLISIPFTLHFLWKTPNTEENPPTTEQP
jgi:Na+-driven multidrug efflux pump